MAHKAFLGCEEKPELRDLSRLTPVETVLYGELTKDVRCSGLRLEQERIRYRWIQQYLAQFS